MNNLAAVAASARATNPYSQLTAAAASQNGVQAQILAALSACQNNVNTRYVRQAILFEKLV